MRGDYRNRAAGGSLDTANTIIHWQPLHRMMKLRRESQSLFACDCEQCGYDHQGRRGSHPKHKPEFLNAKRKRRVALAPMLSASDRFGSLEKIADGRVRAAPAGRKRR